MQNKFSKTKGLKNIKKNYKTKKYYERLNTLEKYKE
jgi:hypothetical protein